MTPSKLPFDSLDSEASETTVKPLRLLGQQHVPTNSSPVRSRGRTPSKKSQQKPAAAADQGGIAFTGFMYPSIPRSQQQQPLRLDSPPKPAGSLLDSRVKQNRRLDDFEETPLKNHLSSSDWPTESLVTPVAQTSGRASGAGRVSAPDFDEATVKANRVRQEAVPLSAGKGTIFISRPAANRKTVPVSQFIVGWNWRNLSSGLLLLTAFLATLFYHGEISEALSQFVDLYISPLAIKKASSPSSDAILMDMETVFADLRVLRQDFERIPAIDTSAISDRIDRIDAHSASTETLMLGLRQRLAEIQGRLDELADRKALSELTRSVGSLEGRIDATEKALGAVHSFASGYDNKFRELSEQVRSIESSETIIEAAVRRMESRLPEHLLVRVSSKGEIQIDPRLFTRLQALLRPATDAEDAKAIQAEITSEVESHLRTRMDDIERRLIERGAVVDMIKKQMSEALSTIQPPEIRAEPDWSQMEARLLEIVLSRVPAVDSRTYSSSSSHGINYATEAAGARAVLALSSASYKQSRSAWDKYLSFGVPSKPHRLALSPDNSLGSCWAFSGSVGQLTVQLAQDLTARAVSLCHLSKESQLDRSSAPALFEVHAIPSISEPKATTLLGTFAYGLDGESCQYFEVGESQLARHYQLRVLSNHGHPEYTCIYQFGIHTV